jgi:hypothetical protein
MVFVDYCITVIFYETNFALCGGNLPGGNKVGANRRFGAGNGGT